MTEQETTEIIAKWHRYSLLGSPEEPDYGPDTPRAYGLSSAEKSYQDKSRDHWSTTQELIDERTKNKDAKEAYEKVEPIYKGLGYMERLHVTTYYFNRDKFSGPVPRQVQESVNQFRGKVANEGR